MNRQLFYKPVQFSLQTAVADMLFSMLLLLTAVTQVRSAPTDSTLTTDKLHTVLCVWNVAQRHFATGNFLVVSMPRTTPMYVVRSDLRVPLPQTDDLQ